MTATTSRCCSTTTAIASCSCRSCSSATCCGQHRRNRRSRRPSLAGALQEAGDEGERRPVQVPVAGDGVGPQLYVWSGEGKEAHSFADSVVERKQSDAKACSDHVLHEVEAVRLVGDAGGEPGHGCERADDVLVRGVA